MTLCNVYVKIIYAKIRNDDNLTFKENELQAEIVRNGLTTKTFCKKLGINPATFYRKTNGKTDFYRNEIVKISEILHLDKEAICRIFLTFNLRLRR